MKKRYIIIAALIIALFVLAFMGEKKEVNSFENICSMLLDEVPEPSVSSLGGEWTVTALARAGYDVPEGYFEKYYSNLSAYLKENDGVLHKSRYTEYSRVIIALSAIGASPENVGGYNLILPLSDYEKTVKQGVNGAVFALLALDSGNYEIPENSDAEVQATREMYVKKLCENQNKDGGFSLKGESDIDLTAMVLQALANYRDNEEVKAVVEKGIECLSEMYLNGKAENAESVSQVAMALCELGIDFGDERFVKDEKTVPELVSDYVNSLSLSDGDELLTAEQLLYATVNIERVTSGKKSFYDMSDTQKREFSITEKSDKKEVSENVKPENGGFKCKLSIRCDTVVDNLSKLEDGKEEFVPKDGIILSEEVAFSDGETAFEVLKRVLKEKKIPFEFEISPSQKAIYIEGINNLYEFDCGELSGWLYSINGEFPEKSIGDYAVKNGDKIEIVYSCDSGEDVGNGK